MEPKPSEHRLIIIFAIEKEKINVEPIYNYWSMDFGKVPRSNFGADDGNFPTTVNRDKDVQPITPFSLSRNDVKQ
jgi:hypothetical protein